MDRNIGFIIVLLLLAIFIRWAGRQEETAPVPQREVFRGIASYYGDGFHGKCMANGQIFDKEAMTAASKDFRLGTKLAVQRGPHSVNVVVTDRGPYIEGRHLDLSEGAARKLNMLDVGVSPVVVKVLEVPAKNKKYHKAYKRCLARLNQVQSSLQTPAPAGVFSCAILTRMNDITIPTNSNYLVATPRLSLPPSSSSHLRV